MSNPDALANSQEPMFTGSNDRFSEDPTDGTFPTDTEQPETQGDEPLEAEIGEDGQGDLAPEDEGSQHSGDAPNDLRTAE